MVNTNNTYTFVLLVNSIVFTFSELVEDEASVSLFIFFNCLEQGQSPFLTSFYIILFDFFLKFLLPCPYYPPKRVRGGGAK